MAGKNPKGASKSPASKDARSPETSARHGAKVQDICPERQDSAVRPDPLDKIKETAEKKGDRQLPANTGLAMRFSVARCPAIGNQMKYEKRYKYMLKLSPRQLEELSAYHIVDIFMMDGRSLSSLPNINPKWIEQTKYKDFNIYGMQDLKKVGDTRDTGRLLIRKTRKGFVVTMKFNWRSKGIKKEKYVCKRCQKSDFTDYGGVCEKCANELRKKRQYSKFCWGG